MPIIRKKPKRKTILLTWQLTLVLQLLALAIFVVNIYMVVQSQIVKPAEEDANVAEDSGKAVVSDWYKNKSLQRLQLMSSERQRTERLGHFAATTKNSSLEKKGDNENVTPSKFNSSKTESDTKYHVIFSTGCSAFQDWQTYMFFFHAMKSEQVGRVTRIASGCGKKDAKELQELQEKYYSKMSPNFHLHLTPDYTRLKKGVTFKYFNKPFGTLHWMENELGYPDNKEHDDEIILLLDPDQIILRPFTDTFERRNEEWRPRKTHPHYWKVEHGRPFAQQYGYHTQWKHKTNITLIAKPEERPSNVELMSSQEAIENYATGPPYIATARDFYSIVKKWTEFVLPVHDQYPYLLAEMFAYSLAAAHLNLPHQIAHSFMVSDIEQGGMEGFKCLVDKLGKDEVCGGNLDRDRLPHVLHYCQSYNLGKWFINKYRLPKDFISCDAPLLRVPPKDIATKFNYSQSPSGKKKELSNEKHILRHAFMLCQVIPAFNDAARYYKENHCDDSANFEETFIFFDSIE